MDIKVYNQSGKSEGTVTVSDKVFGARINADLIYQVATSQMSNKRQVLAHAKTRSEVRGGGKKPWKQKGTGRARHGSIRSPIWIGGGVAHGPSRDVNFKKKVPGVAARKALAAVMSSRVTDKHLVVVDTLDIASGKTKDAVRAFASIVKGLDGYKAGDRILLALSGGKDDMSVRRAVSNLQYVDAYRASDLNALIALSYPYVVVTKDALENLEKRFITKA
jgi:large subunit ribosomal protein L4